MCETAYMQCHTVCEGVYVLKPRICSVTQRVRTCMCETAGMQCHTVCEDVYVLNRLYVP